MTIPAQQQPRKSKSGVLFGNSNYPGDGEYTFKVMFWETECKVRIATNDDQDGQRIARIAFKQENKYPADFEYQDV